MSTHNQEQTDGRTTLTDKAVLKEHAPIISLVVFTALDRLITVANWSLESNPLVSSMGILPWIGLTLITITGAVSIWSLFNLNELWYMRLWVWGFALLTGGVFLSNAFVVYLA